MLPNVTARRIPPGGHAPPTEVNSKLKFPREERLKQYLFAYWLRPENAMWMTLRSEALAEVPLLRPSADFCCGDGIFTFLHAGGVLDPTFDIFCVTKAESKADSLGNRVSSHSHDMFDCVSDAYCPTILEAPSEMVDEGMDLKDSLLEKASRLRFYNRTIAHDCNQRLPFVDESLQTIYCNSAYWVREIDRFLREIGRVLRPGGVAVLHVNLDTMKRCNLNEFRGVLGNRFLEIVTGDRLDNWVTLCDRATWERRFQQAGLSVKSQIPLATTTHARLWDVGLRPLAPLLVRLANAADPKTRAAVKRDWVELMCHLTLPLCDPSLSLDSRKSEAVEIQYVLTRR